MAECIGSDVCYNLHRGHTMILDVSRPAERGTAGYTFLCG